MSFKELKNKQWFKFMSNKYVLVLTLFVVWMLFLDSNSWLVHRELNQEIEEIEANTLYYKKEKELTSNKIGFIAYGSGSKSKVFEAELEGSWKSQIAKTNLFEELEKTTAIDFKTYEALHKKELTNSVIQASNEVALIGIEKENPVLIGKRNYVFKA